MDSNTNRAKQFLPFDALDGLKEALHKKEEISEEKKELSEEQIEKLSYKIRSLNINDSVKIKYYARGKYVKITGKIKKIDYYNKKIIIDEVSVKFDDILDINYIIS